MPKIARTREAVYYDPPDRPQSNEYLRQPAAAKLLGLSESWLEKARLTGKGPTFSRLPGSKVIVYRRSDIDAWVAAGVRQSTSEAA